MEFLYQESKELVHSRKLMRLRLKKVRWGAYEGLHRLVDAYEAAKSVVEWEQTEENYRRFVGLLFKMNRCREVEVVLPKMREVHGDSKWIRDQFKQCRQMAKVDPSIMFEIHIFERIAFYFKRANLIKMDDKKITKAGTWAPLFGTCQAATKHIPDCLTLVCKSRSLIHLARIRGIRNVMLLRNNEQPEQITIEECQIRSLFIYYLVSVPVVRIPGLKSLTLEKHCRVGVVDLTGVKSLKIHCDGNTSYYGSLDSIEYLSLDGTNYGDLLSRTFPRLRTLKLLYFRDARVIRNLLANHRHSLRYLVLSRYKLDDLKEAIRESGILPHLRGIWIDEVGEMCKVSLTEVTF